MDIWDNRDNHSVYEDRDYVFPGGRVGVLPYMSYIGLCGP